VTPLWLAYNKRPKSRENAGDAFNGEADQDVNPVFQPLQVRRFVFALSSSAVLIVAHNGTNN